ncbi:hypothetical protein BC827DRAFT_595658 [Russula dissimulans]|nr:hypothetical protein BC827DRAFT_595658 [Russula dissimulans]
MRSLSRNLVPTAGAITPYLDTPPAIRPCRRPTCLPLTPCTSRPPAICSLAAGTASVRCIADLPVDHHFILASPFSNLNNVRGARRELSVSGCARHAKTHHQAVAQLSLSLCFLLPSIKLKPSQPFPCNPSFTIYRMPFHPFWPHPHPSAQGLPSCRQPGRKTPQMESLLLPLIDNVQG